MTTIFISDLHLDASRPHITRLFVDFVTNEARNADALYILGDLFEAWIGDDADDATGNQVATALRDLRERGVPCFYIHGNRDFLLGDAYARRAGITLLPDPALIDLYGQPTLLMHGDTLCIDDAPYQAFRRESHTPQWQHTFLAKPIVDRRAFAAQAREHSQRYTREASADIMDVNAQAVIETMRANGVKRMIHGHTHRPAIHRIEIDGAIAERIVLGDWYEQGSLLAVDAESGIALNQIPTQS